MTSGLHYSIITLGQTNVNLMHTIHQIFVSISLFWNIGKQSSVTLVQNQLSEFFSIEVPPVENITLIFPWNNSYLGYLFYYTGMEVVRKLNDSILLLQ